MTCQSNCTLPDSLLEQIAEQGLGILPELVRIVVNTAIPAERGVTDDENLITEVTDFYRKLVALPRALS